MRIRKKLAKIRDRSQSGFSLIELGMTLIAIAISTATISLLLSNNAETLKSKAIAEKMKLVTSAAHQYMTKNQIDLDAALPATGNTIAIPVGKKCATCSEPAGPSAALPSIQTEGLLPSGFIDLNNAQQSHALIVRKLANGDLEGVVTTYGGSSLEDEDIGYVSGMLGSFGGGVYGNAAIAPTNQISGAAGGWGDNVTNWNATLPDGTNVRPRSGTIQASLSMAGDSGLKPIDPDDILYRKAIPGAPERNRMETDINMNGNDVLMNNGRIDNAAEVEAAIFRDWNNNGYYLDPYSAGTSLNARGTLNTAGNITAGGTAYATGRISTPADMRSDIYYDIDDPNFYLNADYISRLQTLNTAGKIHAQGAGIDIEADNRMIAGTAFRINGRDVITSGHDADFDNVTARAASYLQGNVFMNTVGGNTRIYNNLTVDDSTFLQGRVETRGWLVAYDRLYGQTDVILNNINGSTTIKGNLELRSGLTGNGATFSGNMTARAYYYGSDERLKEDIRDVDGWAVISKLKPKAYKFKQDGRESMGLIAQDVEKDFPELVQTDAETGMKSVNYLDLIAPLIDTVQELKGQVETLEAELGELRAVTP